MKLKRDISTTSAPASDQVDIGELVINAKTGILYSKNTDGVIIKFLGTPVCSTNIDYTIPIPVPEISFSDVTNFCCGGDNLTVYVSNLLVNHEYSCSAVDLISESTATYSPLSINLLPINKSDRIAMFNITIDKTIQPISLFKISIFETIIVGGAQTSRLLSEKVIKICCNNC